MRYLVLDIETIRDPATWATPDPDAPRTLEGALLDREGAITGSVTGTVRLPPRDAFAPPYGWRPIVIGAVLLEDGPKGGACVVRRVGTIDVPKDGDPDAWERSLLERFAEVIQKQGPELVTWNGRAFDLPVLMLRSLRYGIIHPWYYRSRGYRYRFSEEGHCDLADAMGDYGAARSLSLDGMAKLIGLPGKFGDIDGAHVGEAFAAGRHQEIGAYCLADAVQTAFLFLRWRLHQGELGLTAYRATAAELLHLCAAEPRLGELVFRVDRNVLLLEHGAATEHAPEAA